MTSASRMALTALFALAPFAASPASAQTASIGTNPAGSVFYAIGSGLAKVTAEHTPIRISVQP